MVKPSSEYIHVDNCIIFEILNIRYNLVTVEAIFFHLGVYNNGLLATTYQPFRYVVCVLHINSKEQPLLTTFTFHHTLFKYGIGYCIPVKLIRQLFKIEITTNHLNVRGVHLKASALGNQRAEVAQLDQFNKLLFMGPVMHDFVK